MHLYFSEGGVYFSEGHVRRRQRSYFSDD